MGRSRSCSGRCRSSRSNARLYEGLSLTRIAEVEQHRSGYRNWEGCAEQDNDQREDAAGAGQGAREREEEGERRRCSNRNEEAGAEELRMFQDRSVCINARTKESSTTLMGASAAFEHHRRGRGIDVICDIALTLNLSITIPVIMGLDATIMSIFTVLSQLLGLSSDVTYVFTDCVNGNRSGTRSPLAILSRLLRG